MPISFQVGSEDAFWSSSTPRFDLVDKVEFPQGLEKNKKDARAAAARHAMACLLDIDEEQLNPQYLGKITWERKWMLK